MTFTVISVDNAINMYTKQRTGIVVDGLKLTLEIVDADVEWFIWRAWVDRLLLLCSMLFQHLQIGFGTCSTLSYIFLLPR